MPAATDSVTRALTTDELEAVVCRHSRWSGRALRLEALGDDARERTGMRIVRTPDLDVWLLRWPPGTRVTPHDHGDSAGAFAVLRGELIELRWHGSLPECRLVTAGESVSLERGVVHDVVAANGVAYSVHAYSPPLDTMSFYEVNEPSAVDRRLAVARARIAPRVTAPDLDAALSAGALVVDTRSAAQRDRDGALPGALVVERNVLEWRLDPTSPHRLEQMDRPDRRVIVVCDEGYGSSLAAAALADLGLTDVTDLEGGYQAWRRWRRG